MKQVQDKREFEKKIVGEMIDLYASHHPQDTWCDDLKTYASARVDRCPMMETKTFCSACKIHCYRPEEREQIRKVMRYSGPRMLFHHPLMTIRHLWIEHCNVLKRVLYLILGFIGLGLGILGAILPLLPAFPFLLLAAFGFARSSERLHTWFLQTNLYKNNIQEWVEHRGMKKSTKRRVMIVISLVMLFGFIMMRRVPVCQFILFLVWLGHVLYFRYKMKTLPETAI